MKRKKFGLPVGLVALLLVIGIGAMGVAYTWWTDELTINGSVATGNVDVIFDGTPTDNDVDDDPEVTGTDDVGKCTVSIADPATGTLTITNAYPGYTCTGTFTVKNNGSIDVKLNGTSGIQINSTDATDGVPLSLDIGGPGALDVAVTVTDVLTPLAAGVSDAFTVKVVVLSGTDLPQASGPHLITVELNYVQFNAP